jgi:hypothetical protein
MASMGAQAFGLGASTGASFIGAKIQKDQLRHQAAMAEINAAVTEEAARNTIRAGTIEESRIKMAGAQAKGSQIARIASSGVDIAGSNTALARLTGTDLITEVDAQTVRANAYREAMGQRFQATNLRNQARSSRATAKGISPGLAATTTLLSGAGQVASSWYTMNETGAFDPPKKSESYTSPVETSPTLLMGMGW